MLFINGGIIIVVYDGNNNIIVNDSSGIGSHSGSGSGVGSSNSSNSTLKYSLFFYINKMFTVKILANCKSSHYYCCRRY